MEVVAIIVAICLVLIFVRVLHPADMRINKKYLGKVLKDKAGKGPTKMRSKRLEVVTPPGTPEERVYYAIELDFPAGEKQDVLVQVFYPLEIYFAEKEKRDRASQAEDPNMNTMTNVSSPGSSSDLEKYREDPFKDLSEEEKVRQAKEAVLAAEVRQLQLLNFSDSTVFPKLVHFDPKKHVVIAESIGVERLDSFLNRSNGEEREQLLDSLVQDLAAFHNGGKSLAAQLLPGNVHDTTVIRSQLLSSIDGWSQMGVSISAEEYQKIIEATRPLYEGIELEMGPKMGDAAPRGFFVRQGRVRSLEWGKARRDISLLDVIEVVCDPATNLDFAAESRLFKSYANARTLESETQAEIIMLLTRMAVYYRLVLLSYMGQYLQALKTMSPEKRKSLEKNYWPVDSFPQAVANLKSLLGTDAELETLKDLLEDKLTQLTTQLASA